MVRRTLLTLLVCLSAAAPAAAICELSPYGKQPCELFWTFDAVFDGTIRSIIQREGNPAAQFWVMRQQHRIVTFDVHRAWWGNVGSQIQLVLPGGAGLIISEGFEGSVGQRYLMFARRFEKGGPLSASGCDPSAPIDERFSKTMLAFLDTLPQPSRGARFFGTIDGRTMSEKHGKAAAREYQLVLEGEKTRRQITTVKGRFDFGRLPPGTYRFYIKVPEWPNGRGGPSTISLPHPHACLRQDIVLADK
jgi:hypothetical protein